MRTSHVMIDLETISTSPDAAILSMAARYFDPYGLWWEPNGFYQNIDLNSCLNKGMDFDGDTFNWWLKQSGSARHALMGDQVHILWALESLNEYLLEYGEAENVWCHATFDLPILSEAFKKCNMVSEYGFRAGRDIRTLEMLVPGVEIERLGEAHNANDDVCNQILYVQAMMREGGFNASSDKQEQ